MSVPIKCLSPIRIRNKYTGQWMFVPCRKCDACLINAANTGVYHLSKEMKKYPFHIFLTLTYDNEHLPYMTCDSGKVYRGYPSTFPQIIEEMPFILDSFHSPAGFPENGEFSGILYYKDLQNFFKRLRINYERKTKCKFPYRYYAIGEYGTIGKRPHFHILFSGFDAPTESFRNLCFKSWQMCDWNRLDLEKVYQYASSGVSNYLASYINCVSDSSKFLYYKEIRPKSLRSKNLAFGTDNEMESLFKSFICNGFEGKCLHSDFDPFERIDTTKLDCSSVVLLPKKYISSFYALPAGLCRVNFDDFAGCVRKVISTDRKTLENSDYACALSYSKYLKLTNRNDTLSAQLDFTLDSWLVTNYYKSLIIKHSMLDYDPNKPKEYLASRIQSYSEDLNLRGFRMKGKGIDNYDLFVQSPAFETELRQYVEQYKYKLLPKHLKELVNNENNF